MQVDLVQTQTRDGMRLDGMLQTPGIPPAVPVDAVCLVHGTGGNFYSSSLFDALGERLLQLGVAVLRVNTRGHDNISTAVTAKGGLRLGAAYEIVDDCRHDITAWFDWLKAKAGPRVALLGHSLGAVKCLYTVAHEPPLEPACVIAISPPRLAYSWFCSTPKAEEFLQIYRRAEALMEAGQPAALLDVKFPLPFVITAAGYVEKYGPDERYNYLPLLHSLRVPTLVTLGSVEVAGNVAFQGAPEAIEELRQRQPLMHLEVIPEADHFYAGVREQLADYVASWLRRLESRL